MNPDKKKRFVAYPEEANHTGTYLNINSKELEILKSSYQKALEEEKGMFIFQDKEIVTNYAKYLIEYLNTQNI